MRFLQIIPILVCGGVFVSGCGQDDGSRPSDVNPAVSGAPATTPDSAKPMPPAGLGGRVWNLVELRGEAVQIAAGKRAPGIEFDPGSSGASGYAGCNTFSGSFKAGDSAIRLGPFAVTRMACPGGSDIEQTYLGAMAQTQSYRVDADSLEFIGAEGDVLARFTPQGA